ncbi:MAG: leucyl aminopeptidase [Bacteroidetes bacterium]|nr:MAG: leucyl aminopeptidase [Bacteroidota bacterium]
MTFTAVSAPLSSLSAELAAFIIFRDPPRYKESIRTLQGFIGWKSLTPVMERDFAAKEGETLLVYSESPKVRRVLLVGAGDAKSFTLERLRRAAASAAKRAKALKCSSVLLHPGAAADVLDADAGSMGTAIAEGALLSMYKFDRYLSTKSTPAPKKFTVAAHGASFAAAMNAGLRRGIVLAEAVRHARDLANAPGSEIYPETLARDAQASGRRHGFSVRVLTEREILRAKMGGVLAVSQGSVRKPRFIIMEHGRRFASRGTVVLVGKGVTFDTGGISIKPAANMAEMKMDMSGAAAVIGTMEASARLKVKRHIVGLVPAVENMPSGSAVKPGDIVRHLNGKTSEVDNTDAEGRLILADALSYAVRYKPSLVVDLATLTGAVVVALGHYATGMMGNDTAVMESMSAAGESTYERVWPLPLFDEYEKLIKSDVADVKNVGGRWAGAITAGWFLKKFIGDHPWVHLDIAGTAILEADQDYTPRGGSGVGVRLLTEFLRRWK